MEAVPQLMSPLQCHDAKVLEHASVYLTRIVETFASSPEEVDELCKHRLVDPVASLVSANNSEGIKTLFLLSVSGMLKGKLSGFNLVVSISISSAGFL